MSEANKKTLQSYEAHVTEYIAGTPQAVDGHVQDWIDRSLSYISAGSTILEIGSAFGRDADYIESHGYRVERTDATKSFVEFLRKHGHDAKVLNALTDELGGPYDMALANAVLLHFTPDEAARARLPTSVIA